MYELVSSDAKCLSTKIPPIKKITKKHLKVIKEMKKILEADDGAAAYSANQLGITDLRAFVCKNGDEITAVINPKITWRSTDDPSVVVQDENGVIPQSVPMWEGCMSFPGYNYLINRPYAIKVEYMNEKGKMKLVTLSDQWARLFCHEIDHLNGIRVSDRAEETMETNPDQPIGYLPTKEIVE